MCYNLVSQKPYSLRIRYYYISLVRQRYIEDVSKWVRLNFMEIFMDIGGVYLVNLAGGSWGTRMPGSRRGRRSR